MSAAGINEAIRPADRAAVDGSGPLALGHVPSLRIDLTSLSLGHRPVLHR